MNKTHIVSTLPCGCVERRWVFGRDFLRECAAHGGTRNQPRCWSMAPAATGEEG